MSKKSCLLNMPRHLGKNSAYKGALDPALLEFIPRAQTRNGPDLVFPSKLEGFDRWVAHELMWRNEAGAVVAGRLFFEVDCHSLAMVESKSLKLYLFGLATSRFASAESVCAQIRADLVAGLKGEVRLWIENSPNRFSGARRVHLAADEPGQPLPAANPVSFGNTPQATDSGWRKIPQTPAVEQTYYTHTFRSLCPVTGQPDFATVQVHLVAAPIRPQRLADYLARFFDHAAFHEACVETIFTRLYHAYLPQSLTVRACFTRRGGIEINPLRSLDRSPFSWTGAWRQ